MSAEYNGWTNYATWRVLLEHEEYLTALTHEAAENETDAGSVAHELRMAIEEYFHHATEHLAPGAVDTLCSYGLAFMADVNWYEIATHLLEP